jgi:hypothetical protein
MNARRITPHLRPALFLLAMLVLLTGCAAPYDYSAYRPFVLHMPRSILVLPPINHSANVHASDAFLSTVTQPLAELGYYVYPIAVVDHVFKDNGAPTPGDMHRVPLEKIRTVFNPDAVMYINIKTWTTTYIFVDSSSIVDMEYKLVDTATGTVLWQHTGSFIDSSTAAALATDRAFLFTVIPFAQARAIAAAASNGEFERQAAAQANQQTFSAPYGGLLLGPHHPGYEKNQAWIKEEIARSDAAKPES